MSAWLKNNQNIIILAVLAVVFFFVYSWLFWGSPAKFTSPDETANYYFTKLFAEKNQLRFSDSLNQVTGGIVHPRSMRYENGFIVPSSFLGIILIFGLLAKIVGVKLILFLTPLISAVAVIFFYLLLREIFSRRIAFFSAVLLFFLPPFWYYASRGMFHNALFIDSLIIGFYFLVKAVHSGQKEKRGLLRFIFGGFFIGLALIVRTSEILWVGFVVVVLLVLNRKKITWWRAMIFFGIIIIFFIPILYFNNQLNGSPTSFAYLPSGGDDSGQSAVSASDVILKTGKLLLPFGVNGRHIAEVVYYYIIGIFPWFSIGLVIYFAWLLRCLIVSGIKKIIPGSTIKQVILSTKERAYFILYILLFIWLVIYYGSYTFYEYFDKSKILLGSSYLRYWLPIFVFGLPLVVRGFEKMSTLFKHGWAQRIAVVLLICLFIVLSVHVTLFDSIQGLFQVKKNIQQEASLEEGVAGLTPANAVILSGYADKIFFPARRVIVGLPDGVGTAEKTMVSTLKSAPLYYFSNPLDEQSQETFFMLTQHGFQLERIDAVTDSNGALYRIHVD
jgi:hypothetical protein